MQPRGCFWKLILGTEISFEDLLFGINRDESNHLTTVSEVKFICWMNEKYMHT